MDQQQQQVDIDTAKKQYAKIQDYQNLFSSDTGKRVLMDMMQQHHLLSPTYQGKSQNAHFEMMMMEGERNVILRILHLIGYDMEVLQQRIKEMRNAR